MSSPNRSWSIAIPFICLFVSGAASLVYELVWIKQLVLVFGGTLYAISAVLCAFMTGLALGAWACTHYLKRLKISGARPLVKLYGLIEGGIGIYGLLFPVCLELLTRLYPLALSESHQPGPFLHVMEFFFSALLMLPATCLMGATLPVIGSWAIGGQARKVFSRISILYGLNTLGAVVGCLYTQFFALRFFGIQATTWSAVSMNFAVFLICWFAREPSTLEDSEKRAPFAQEVDMDEDRGDEPVPSKVLSVLLLSIFTYSGVVSLSSEILWTRVLVFPMGSTLYSFALILATFLLSIAIGSLFAEKLLGNSRWIFKFLLIELAVGVIGIAILPLFDRLPDWTLAADRIFYDIGNSPNKTLLVRSLFAFGIMFVPTLGFGLIFPLANRIHLSLFGTVSRTLGNIYALSTLGAVAGTVLTPFVLVPLLGIRLSLFVLYSLLALVSIISLVVFMKWKPTRLTLASAGAIALLVCGYAWSTPKVDIQKPGERNLSRIEIDTPRERIRLLDYKEGDFSTLSVVEDIESGARTLYMNGFSTATVSNTVSGSAYMRAMGFVPMVLHPDPKKALVIGFGTGNTLGTVSLFPEVEADGVEIDRNVLSMARWFSSWNHDVLSRPNVRVSIQDGRTFLRWNPAAYDVITLEPMAPVQAGVVNLYSREFYELGKSRLKEGGLIMQWLPLHLVGRDDAKSIIKTFQAVFPHVSIWNSFLTRIVLLVGSRHPVVADKTRFDILMQNGDLRKSAEQMAVYSFLDLLDFFMTTGDQLESYLDHAEMITDDRPILEHSPVTLLPPLQWETDESFINLLRHRVDHFPDMAGLDSAERALLNRHLNIRTAQRLAVFSRRYHGPGEEAFAVKNYPAGLEAMRIDLENLGDRPISLKDARWRD
ncbi:MAG: fused MFS/spermidine synthase [Nitrospinota bacterium]|nr:fused MFS/spermidine synthase [Nitrospinota bacterium]